MKEISIDCPINYNGNVFPEEIKENKGCIQPKIGEAIKSIKNLCPSRCDFMQCDYECYDKTLNLEYYDNSEYSLQGVFMFEKKYKLENLPEEIKSNLPYNYDAVVSSINNWLKYSGYSNL